MKTIALTQRSWISLYKQELYTRPAYIIQLQRLSICLLISSTLLARGVFAGQADTSVPVKLLQAAPQVGSNAASSEADADSEQAIDDSGIVAAPGADSAKSEEELIYRSTAKSLRRDASATPAAPDTHRIAQKKIDESQSVSPPPQTPQKDAYVVIPGRENPAPSGSRPQLKKRSVFLIIGACALVGGGIALYVIKNSQNKGATAINNRIPPPPDPPPSHMAQR